MLPGDHALVMGRYLVLGLWCEAWQLDELAADESGSGRVWKDSARRR
jgi:hypothetical protein